MRAPGITNLEELFVEGACVSKHQPSALRPCEPSADAINFRSRSLFQRRPARQRGEAHDVGLCGNVGESTEEATPERNRRFWVLAEIISLPNRRRHGSGGRAYEISRYGTLKSWATKLGKNSAVRLLDQTLSEEKKTDEILTKLAETEVNAEAA
jgi:hypothetical protein